MTNIFLTSQPQFAIGIQKCLYIVLSLNKTQRFVSATRINQRGKKDFKSYKKR